MKEPELLSNYVIQINGILFNKKITNIKRILLTKSYGKIHNMSARLFSLLKITSFFVFPFRLNLNIVKKKCFQYKLSVFGQASEHLYRQCI